MQNACAAFFVGALMLVGSAVLLWWNEGTAVERYETLELARREVLELGEGARAGSGGRGRLVHVTAVASGEVLDDGTFGVAVPALRLRRDAQTMQWVEKTSERKRQGGGRDVTYSYSRQWRGERVRSEGFHRGGYDNPVSLRYSPAEWDARVSLAGGFELAPSLVQKLSGFQSVELDASEASSQREEANGLIAARRAAGAAGSDAVALRDERALSRPTQVAYVPRGYSASHSKLQSYRPGTEPEVGDVEVRFSAVPSGQVVSVLAKQDSSGKLSAWRPPASKTRGSGASSVAVVAFGDVSAAELIASEVTANTIRTFALRGVGTLLCFFGFLLLSSPITTLVGVVEFVPIVGPMLSGLVGAGLCFASLTLGLAMATCTIAAAWIAHRPLFATLAIGAAIAVLCMGSRTGHGAGRTTGHAPTAPPVEPTAAAKTF